MKKIWIGTKTKRPEATAAHLSHLPTKAGAPHAVTFPGDPRHSPPKQRAHPEHSKPKPNRLSVKIAGEAGFGIGVSGLMLSKTLSRGGLSVMDYTEYPSLVRGGHNTFLLRVDDQPVTAPIATLNVLIALNKAAVVLHESELAEDGVILYDANEIELAEGDVKNPSVQLYGVPFEDLAVQSGGEKLMRNVVALGAFLALTGYPLDILDEVIRDVFSDKGKDKVIVDNVAAAAAGHQYMQKHFSQQLTHTLRPVNRQTDQIVLTGAEAVSLGTIAADCKFYAAYPMTPASPVLHYLAAKQHEVGMIVEHVEDEIAAMNIIIGAAFAGVRAMTGTSGGGFALMVEGLGLAAITETPIVVFEAMRPGPATGLPTWTDQGDLRFILHSAQGEFPRVILAPGDVDDSFYLTHEAFNLADRFQLPVFVLSDKYLAESHFTTKPFDRSKLKIDRGKMVSERELKRRSRRFKRYELAADGVSPRSVPGQEGGIYMANSDEHDEFGYSSEDSHMRTAQMNKRFAKLRELEKAVPSAKLHGPTQADLTIVGWGSTKGSILEALRHLKHDGITANFLQVVTVWPLPARAIETALQKAPKALLVENNMTAQLGGLIREETGIQMEHRLLKYDGRPIYPEEIYHRAKELI